ncbi:Uma2 family endonuclease [Catalinimonas niigatensis]|uniref:Uma2 family endonuclease n=1 Tax=Catalinimonas niigatensis TaxID=1397264 RepID=UPI002666FB95|nr:Uma2 family endonuclease [Catalinimonas niigatensis]WPP49369.1 Uma2 family endonuclease [Catalinimonas niigatensis]
MESFAIKLPDRVKMTEDEFYAFCQENDHVRMEKTSQGEIIIMAPTGGNTGRVNKNILFELESWNRDMGMGETFDSSTGFMLPNGAVRSPDASWIVRSRWEVLSEDEKKKFPPLCPDFVVELMSESDALMPAQQKMEEWMNNGCRLAWLIQPSEEKVFIYKKGQALKEIKSYSQSLSGEDVLPGFTFDLSWIQK